MSGAPPFVRGRAKTGGRARGVRNKRTILAQPKTYPDALAHLVAVIENNDGTITPELKVRAAIGLAAYQHPKPAPAQTETFISLDYVAPKTPEEARAIILTLGERATRGEISTQAHDLLIGNLRAYLTDKAAEQEKKLAAIERHIRYGSEAPWETSTAELSN